MSPVWGGSAGEHIFPFICSQRALCELPLCSAKSDSGWAVGDTGFSDHFSIRKSLFWASVSHASINYLSLAEQGLLPQVQAT